MLKKIMILMALMGASLAYAFIPQAGTWVVASEVDGKPGRGLAIDVQNSTLVMQMYAYENSGQPTFYLAVGPVANNQVTTPLKRYTGGRYFGSGAQSGKEASSPGNVSIRFISGIAGFITFPGESEKAISRFNFGYAFEPDSLVGTWILTRGQPSGSWAAEVPTLVKKISPTQYGNGLVTTSDGLFGCEHQIAGELAGTVICVQLNSALKMTMSYVFVYSVNDGEGDWGGSNGQVEGALYVKRLLTAQGTNTGLLRKTDAAIDPSHAAALLHEISVLAQSSR